MLYANPVSRPCGRAWHGRLRHHPTPRVGGPAGDAYIDDDGDRRRASSSLAAARPRAGYEVLHSDRVGPALATAQFRCGDRRLGAIGSAGAAALPVECAI